MLGLVFSVTYYQGVDADAGLSDFYRLIGGGGVLLSAVQLPGDASCKVLPQGVFQQGGEGGRLLPLYLFAHLQPQHILLVAQRQLSAGVLALSCGVGHVHLGYDVHK